MWTRKSRLKVCQWSWHDEESVKTWVWLWNETFVTWVIIKGCTGIRRILECCEIHWSDFEVSNVCMKIFPCMLNSRDFETEAYKQQTSCKFQLLVALINNFCVVIPINSYILVSTHIELFLDNNIHCWTMIREEDGAPNKATPIFRGNLISFFTSMVCWDMPY